MSGKVERAYIYLLRVYPEHPVNVYKLGKTKRDIFARYKEYPSAHIEMVYNCRCSADIDSSERELLNEFRDKFDERKDMGSEYFSGDGEAMKMCILSYFAKRYGNLEYNVGNPVSVGDGELKSMVSKLVNESKRSTIEINKMRVVIEAYLSRNSKIKLNPTESFEYNTMITKEEYESWNTKEFIDMWLSFANARYQGSNAIFVQNKQNKTFIVYRKVNGEMTPITLYESDIVDNILMPFCKQINEFKRNKIAKSIIKKRDSYIWIYVRILQRHLLELNGKKIYRKRKTAKGEDQVDEQDENEKENDEENDEENEDE